MCALLDSCALYSLLRRTPRALKLVCSSNDDHSSYSPATDVGRYTADLGTATAAKLVLRRSTSHRNSGGGIGGGGGGRPSACWGFLVAHGRLSEGNDDEEENEYGDGADTQALRDLIAFRREIAAEEATKKENDEGGLLRSVARC